MGCCGQGIINTVMHGAVGLSKVALRVGITDQETIQKRRDICRFCEFSSKNKNPKFDSTNGLTNMSTCSKCHCNIRMKTQLTTEKCCENKW